ncbi:MAG: methyltransferase domain-containing protein [Pseudomonadota bacterium]
MPELSFTEPYRDFELRGWERAAARYGDSFERATLPFVEPLLGALGLAAGMGLLDLACGTGRLSAAARDRGAWVAGADFAHNMLLQARAAGVPLVRADAERLPFRDAAFDAVAINFGVHHFPYPLRALAEAHRVLGPGGRLAFTVWQSPEINPTQKLVFDAIRALGGGRPELPPPPGGGVTDAAACRRLLHMAGFAEGSITIEAVQAPLEFASGRALVEMLRRGTVQTAAVIDAQPDYEALVAEVERGIERYRDGATLRVPAQALLARAVRA